MQTRLLGLSLSCLFLIHCHSSMGAGPDGVDTAAPAPQAKPVANQVSGTLLGQPVKPQSAAFVRRSYPASAIYPKGFSYLMVVVSSQSDVCATFSAGTYRAGSTTLRMDVTAFGPLYAGAYGSAYFLNGSRAAYSYAVYDGSCRSSGARTLGTLTLLSVSDAQVTGQFSLESGEESLVGTFVATPCPGLDEIDNPVSPGCR